MAAKNKRAVAALDPIMAGFAAGAAAFIVYAMPGPQFEAAVALSGLPSVLAAAQPPLGSTARLAVMAVTAVAAFSLVFLLLRALGKSAPQPKLRSGPVEIEMAPPKLRRADAHPDAPSRRPILAGIDLGRSFDELPADAASPSEPETSEERSAAADDPVEDIPAFQRTIKDDWEEERLSDTLSPESDPIQDGPDAVDDVGFRLSADEEADQSAGEELSIGVEPADEFGKGETLTQSGRDMPLSEPLQPFPNLVSEATGAEDSISSLVARLEAGLSRRKRQSRPPISAADTTNERFSADTGQLDQRLRGAIEELQRISSGSR